MERNRRFLHALSCVQIGLHKAISGRVHPITLDDDERFSSTQNAEAGEGIRPPVAFGLELHSPA